jgi:hypothetical protein
MRSDLFRVLFASGYRKDVTSAVCDRLIALPYNEDAIEQQSSDIVIVRELNVAGFRTKRLRLDLGIPTASKLSYESAFLHWMLPPEDFKSPQPRAYCRHLRSLFDARAPGCP